MMLIRMLSVRERGYYFTVMVLTLRPPLHIQPGRPANHTEPPDYPKAAASPPSTPRGRVWSEIKRAPCKCGGEGAAGNKYKLTADEHR